MDANRFDDLVRGAADRVQSRRGVLFGIAAASMTLAFSLDAAEAGKGRRSRRRRRNVRVCFKGREIVVNRTAARELVSRGARQRGRGRSRRFHGPSSVRRASDSGVRKSAQV